MVLDDLKARIERIEGRTKRFIAADAAQAASGSQWHFGIEALDAALPDDGLALDACHDFTPLTKTDVPQVAGFVLALLQRLPAKHSKQGTRPVVWCQTAFNAREYGRIYAPGLLGTALPPDRLLFINVPKDRDMALVLEECVRVEAVAAVVGEGPAPDFTASRRLTLVAQQSRVPCLIINTSGDVGASAAATRWRVAPIVGPPDPKDPQAPGFPAWAVTLARARGGNTGLNPTMAKPLEVSWNNETHRFDMVSPFRTGEILESASPPDAVSIPISGG